MLTLVFSRETAKITSDVLCSSWRILNKCLMDTPVEVRAEPRLKIFDSDDSRKARFQ